MLKSLKRNLVLILSIVVILSPILYINRNLVVQMIYTIQDTLFPLKPGTLPWLHTEGNSIVDNNNRPVLLRGVNIASNNWSEQYRLWHPSAVKTAAHDWQVNVIRTRIFESDYVANPLVFFRNLEKEIIQPARQAGVYVILHPWLGDNTSLPTQSTKAMWVGIAKRYQHDPTVIYDLLAEPRNINFEALSQAYNDLIPAVRAVNPDALIMVTGLDWGRDINAWATHPLKYPNLVYRTNPYNKQGELEGYFLQLVDHYPVFLGEYGTSEDLTMSLPDVEYLLQLASTYHLGWTAWNFSASGCPCLLSNEQSFTPSEYGKVVLHALTHEVPVLANPPVSRPESGRFSIYSDFLDNGFTDYSWDILRSLVNSDQVYQGKNSIKVEFHQNGGLYLHSTRIIPTPQFQAINLVFSGANPANYTLRLRTADDRLSEAVPFKGHVTPLTSSWSQVSIPLRETGFDTFSSVILESIASAHPEDVFYLDDIYLE